METIRLTLVIFIIVVIILTISIVYYNNTMEHFTPEEDKKKALLEALAKAKLAREATQQKMKARFEAAKAKKAEEERAAIELAALNAAGGSTTGGSTTGGSTTGGSTTGGTTAGGSTTGGSTTGGSTTGGSTTGGSTTGGSTTGGTTGTPSATIAVPNMTTTPNPTTGNFTIYPNNGRGFNISQIGGEGPNNYFHPNIIIKKKKETAEGHAALGNALQSLYPNMSQENIQAAIQQYIFNTGYNFSTGGTSPNTDPWNTALANSAMDASMPNVNSCIDCQKDPETGDINYGGNYGTSYESFTTPRDDENDEENDDRQRNYRPPKYEEEPSPRAGLDGNGNFIPSCKMKTFVPGFQMQPPKCWDVPQKRPPVCLGDKKRLPAAVFDRGTPLNALEMDTTVGSILPKFIYTELPRDRN
jgi:hypothetical protein